MNALKPCYLHNPRALLQRIWYGLRGMPSAITSAPLPWGGAILVNPTEVVGSEILKQGIFDISLSEIIFRVVPEGGRVIDAGANIGYISLLMAARVGRTGRVHSFEPHPVILRLTRANVTRANALLEAEVITLHEQAVGDQPGEANLSETEYFGFNNGTATLEKRDGPVTKSHPVKVVTLDEALPGETWDLLKMDVEGFEPQLLAGATCTLKSGRIRTITYEAWDLEKSPIHDTLAGYGYTVYAIGYRSNGPFITRGSKAVLTTISWEAPNYIATLDPQKLEQALEKSGWSIYQP